MSNNERLEDILRLAREAAQPQLTEPGLRGVFGADPDGWPLRPGVVWRARWDSTALLVLVVRVVSTTVVSCAPVTLDDSGLDHEVLIVDEPERLRTPAAVWRPLVRELSTAVLDRPIDDLGVQVASWVAGGAVPAEARQVSDSTPFRSGSHLHTATEAAMDELANAELPAAATAPSAPAQPVRPSREQYLALRERLDLPLPAVLKLVDGKRSPSPEETAALQDILGFAPAVTTPPAGLVIEMSRPRWKRTVLDLAHRDHLDEAAARQAMASGAFALAARQTGEKEPDWRERLSRWAAAQGLEQP